MNQSEKYELIAKRCPSCESLIMARISEVSPGVKKYDPDYRCSSCQWTNTVSKNTGNS